MIIRKKKFQAPMEDTGFEGMGGDRGDELVVDAAPETPAETPAAETPAVETPAAETPAAETPASETPSAETPENKPEDKDIRVPKTRLDAEIAKRREAEERLARYEAQQKQLSESVNLPELEAKINELDEKHADLLMNGDREQAMAVLRERRDLERQFYSAQAQQTSLSTQTQSEAQSLYEATLRSVEEKFPAFDMNNAAYDDAKTAEVVELYQGMVASGKPHHVALERAANAVAAMYGIGAATAQAEAKPTAADAAAKAAAAARAKVVDAVNKQAPSLAGVANVPDATKGVDLSKMTPEQISAARGDFV